ncbi:MAG: amidophosphoribosyltransferase [Chaenotheca gracillima]|nr:MAG: amidophosphoribosyltransferase [Chaenotheca gracillima]
MSANEDGQPLVKLSLPLEYQQDIFQEVRSEDGLVVLAQGLGILRIVTNLLHSYDAAGSNLVIVVGADDRENDWLTEALAEHAAISMAPNARGFNKINSDSISVATREQMYARGGIFSITSRILIVDLLSALLDPATITGLIVLHADRVVATSTEAFIIRVYRQHNKDGFLKAFSDNPNPFATGFSPLATMMRNLFLRKPSLWPRFHVTVAKSLEGRKKAEVIELEVPMTDSMAEIQAAIIQCVEISIGELKKANSGLEMDEWSFDNSLHRDFDIIVRRQLDRVWHLVSRRTKQIVSDLTTLRTILQFLLSNDAVSFNKYLDTVIAANTPPPGSNRRNESPWMFLDAAHTIFDTAKRRVYTGKVNETALSGSGGIPDSLHPVLEEQPKWAQLAEILEEIERDSYFNPTVFDDSNGSILIMCADQVTCWQLREYLNTMHTAPLGHDHDDISEGERRPSAALMMRKRLRNYLKWKPTFAQVRKSFFEEEQKGFKSVGDSRRNMNGHGRAPPNKRRRVRGGAATVAAGASRASDGIIAVNEEGEMHLARLGVDIQATEIEMQQRLEEGDDQLENMEDFYELYEMSDLVLVHPYDGDLEEHLLEEIKPRHVIMYEPNSAFIRRIEVYRSSHSDRNVKVYFMYYGSSVEEQKYLSAVRKEKDAFEKLIRERANMAITLTLDSRGVEDAQDQFLRTVNTRIAGGGRLAATAEPPRVVVDTRDFGSSLPSLLHGQNMIIVPCLLTVGDYILTPDICIERKSIRDLISSFKDGRLYNQAEKMLQYYKYPMLLIEFDQNKSFTLEPFADLTNPYSSTATNTSVSLQSNDLQTKLVLLALAFPRLKVIWSSSPHQTALIFAELKKNGEEPDPIKAVRMGLQESADGGSAVGAGRSAASAAASASMEHSTFSRLPQEMLRAIPGVNEKAAQALELRIENITELANMSEEALDKIVGGEAGRQIFRFFNRSSFDD